MALLCVSRRSGLFALRGDTSLGCTQQMLLCWVREAAVLLPSPSRDFPWPSLPSQILLLLFPCPHLVPVVVWNVLCRELGGFSLCLYGSLCLLMSWNIKEEAVFFLPDLLFVSLIPTPFWLLFSQHVPGRAVSSLSEGMEGVLLLRVNVGEFLASLQ